MLDIIQAPVLRLSLVIGAGLLGSAMAAAHATNVGA